MKTSFSALVLLLLPLMVLAHPGRTASDGCHYCRTNCEKWGVPYGERHCHNSGYDDTSDTNSGTSLQTSVFKKTTPQPPERPEDMYPLILAIRGESMTQNQSQILAQWLQYFQYRVAEKGY